MKLCDVNVLVYAHREDATPDHSLYAAWLREMASGSSLYGLSEAVLAGFVLVVTNRRIFREPTPIDEALEFCDRLIERPNARILRPGSDNWAIFRSLCRGASACGKLAAEAWHAALAIEYACEWVSTDSDYARFPGLNWRHPLAAD